VLTGIWGDGYQNSLIPGQIGWALWGPGCFKLGGELFGALWGAPFWGHKFGGKHMGVSQGGTLEIPTFCVFLAGNTQEKPGE